MVPADGSCNRGKLFDFRFYVAPAKSMPKRIRFTPSPDRLEAAEEALWALGAQSVTLLDAGDQPLLEPGPGETPLWPESIVEALLPDDLPDQDVLIALSAGQVVSSPKDVQFDHLADRDWERAWMDRFKPMRFGESIWICPSHIDPEPEWGVVVRLDPGLAFGTGTHPTTALCLEWMDGIEFEDRTVTDYGCGSGVLAVAAALKNAATIIAIDHDPQALTATRDNAERNAVGDRIQTALPGELEPAQTDIVLANILAGPLIELAEQIAALVRPGGALVLSGILDAQADEVERAYRPLIGKGRRVSREGWVRLDFNNEK
ncbi:MAG: 50S ribosomal protein L11 methyltransferase [Xanthomonadales bacterium]|nr:50S ribosomal protein L11 methyltransferase [Xanthomonadales bacterium]